MSALWSMTVLSLCSSLSDPNSIPFMFVQLILMFDRFFGLKGLIFFYFFLRGWG